MIQPVIPLRRGTTGDGNAEKRAIPAAGHARTWYFWAIHYNFVHVGIELGSLHSIQVSNFAY